MGKQINLEQIKALADGNTEFIRDILETFSNEAPSMLNELHAKHAEADLAGLAFYAHKLKSNLRLLNLTQAAEAADNIEAHAKASSEYDYEAGLATMKAQLDIALKEVAEEMAAL